MKLPIIMLCLLSVSSLMAKDKDPYSDLKPGSVEAFKCARTLLQSERKEMVEAGAHYFYSLMKENYLNKGNVQLVNKQCQADMSLIRVNDVLKFPPISSYHEKDRKLIQKIIDHSGFCETIEIGVNAGIIVAVGAGISFGKCFGADGRTYADAGLFAQAGDGLGAELNIVSDELTYGKNFEKTKQTSEIIGIDKIENGIAIGLDYSNLDRYHAHGKLIKLKENIKAALRRAINASNIHEDFWRENGGE